MIERIKLLFAEAVDVKTALLSNGEASIEIAYLSSLCKEDKINNYIMIPFTKAEIPFDRHLETNPQYEQVEDPAKWQDMLLRGYVLIQANSVVYSFLASDVISSDGSLTQVESAIQGPQLALSEDLNKSLNLIRSMYPSPELCVEQYTVGYESRTPLYVLFDQRHVDSMVLDNVRSKLTSINADIVHAAGELEKLLVGKRLHLFPTVLITERPDRISRSIGKGKVVVLIKGSMFALIMPATFFEFMHAIEDNYEAYWMTRFLIFLRFASIVLTITLPALYIAVVSYNPELFRVQLAFSIAASRSAVPYPSFIEVFIMLFMIETLIEASIRLPRYIGSTATTVGGLILGQAAQQAGLVSSIMIIVTSVVAISNFVIPINSMSFAIRFLKYPLIGAAIFFGLSGIAAGVFLYIAYLCNLRSFGKPYFRLHGKLNPAEGDIGGADIK